MDRRVVGIWLVFMLIFAASGWREVDQGHDASAFVWLLAAIFTTLFCVLAARPRP